MKPQKNTRSSLFLIELMITILFFSLGSAVCIQVFVKAHTVNEDARRLSFASLQVSSAASALKYTDGSPDALREYFPMLSEDKNGMTVCYDRSFRECEPSEGFFVLRITKESTDGVLHSNIEITAPDRETPIYGLTLRYPDSSGQKERKGE